MENIIKELKHWYALYAENGIKSIDDVQMEKLWIQLYESDKYNADYALGYALFMIGIDEIGDYLKAIEILEPFREDPRCAIVRCESMGWYLKNEEEIENYDFDILLKNAKKRQEKSLLYYYKAIANPNDKELIDKSLSWFQYNIASLSLALKTTKRDSLDYRLYKDLFLYDENFFMKLYHKEEHVNKRLFYKPYIFQNMALLNISWSAVLERRKYWGIRKEDLPPIDLTAFSNEAYFKETIDMYKDYCLILVNGKLIE